MEIIDKTDARKEKIDADKAWDIFAKAGQILIGKGKKILSFKPEEASREEILKAAMGRSGNLRAPTLQVKNTLFVGFNESIYQDLIN